MTLAEPSILFADNHPRCPAKVSGLKARLGGVHLESQDLRGAGGSRVQGRSQLSNEFEASMGFLRPRIGREGRREGRPELGLMRGSVNSSQSGS